MSKVTLSESDWAVLFPQQEHKIGNTTLFLTPLSLLSLSKIMAQITAIIGKMEKLGVPLSDLISTPENTTLLVSVVIQDAPGILSELSGLEENDVSKLPLLVAIDLFSVCLDINLKSQEGLLKNFKRLGEKVAKVTVNPLQS